MKLRFMVVSLSWGMIAYAGRGEESGSTTESTEKRQKRINHGEHGEKTRDFDEAPGVGIAGRFS
jgi:hypothetical protein